MLLSLTQRLMRLKISALVLALGATSSIHAQSAQAWIEVGGGVNQPVGAYGGGQVPGPAFGLAVGYRLRPPLRGFIGIGHSEFKDRRPHLLPVGDPATATEEVRVQQGFALFGYRAGLELHPRPSARIAPWISGAALYHRTDVEMQQQFEGGAVTNIRHIGSYRPGYELATGLDTPLRPGVTLRPALRYQSLHPQLRGGGRSDAALEQITVVVGIARHF